MANTNKLDGIDIIYWINLDRSLDRKQRMLEMFTDDSFSHIPIQRFSAVDGKNDDIDAMISVSKKKITNPEYGCLLSHLEIINNFADSNHDVALILEDDATLDFKKYWDKSVREIMNNAPKDWDIIMLCYHSDGVPKDLYTLNRNNYWSTCAYIIKKGAAKKLIDEIYKNERYVLDDNIKSAADDFLYIKLKTYVYKYPYFIYGYSEKNTIATSNIKYHNMSRRRVEYMFENDRFQKEKATIENFQLYENDTLPIELRQIVDFFRNLWLYILSHDVLSFLLLIFFLFLIIFIIIFGSKRIKLWKIAIE